MVGGSGSGGGGVGGGSGSGGGGVGGGSGSSSSSSTSARDGVVNKMREAKKVEMTEALTVLAAAQRDCNKAARLVAALAELVTTSTTAFARDEAKKRMSTAMTAHNVAKAKVAEFQRVVNRCVSFMGMM